MEVHSLDTSGKSRASSINKKLVNKVLDIGDELNGDLFDDLLDSVLNEIKAKQITNAEDSEDQIMPSASPNIYETDLMDDLDTPFHHDDAETPFGSHKKMVLSYHGYSPDQFQDNFSFDYIDEISRRNRSLDQRGNQNVDMFNPTAHSYSELNRAGIAADYVMTGGSVAKLKEHNSEQLDCHVPSKLFEYHGDRNESFRNMQDDSSSSNSYQSLRQYPDFQALYPDSVEQKQQQQQQDSTRTTNHRQPEDSTAHHRSRQQVPILQDEDSSNMKAEDFLSWRCKHPENWTEAEVLDWIFYSAERNGIDTTNLHGEAFRVTGRDLCLMTMEDFQRLEPQYGQYFYSLFRQLLNGLAFTHPNDMLNMEPHIAVPDERDMQHFLDNSFSPKSMGQGHHEPDEVNYQQQSPSPPSPDQCFPYHPQPRNFTVEYGSAVYPGQAIIDNQVYQSYDCSPNEQSPPFGQAYVCDYSSQQYQSTDRSSYRPYSAEKTSVTSVTSKYAGVITPRRRPGRPRIKSLPTEEELRLRQEKKLKSQHLWEFIFDMLNNPVYNPTVLKWENQNEGVFRFIQSETIAGLWGNLKNNENMTYEKLSRAMRHYYKRGILERVEGRRLVYKFSSSTLQRMNEKRQTAFQNASKDIARVSNIHASESSSTNNMQMTSNDVKTNIIFPHSEETPLLYMRSSPDDVLSASVGMQFVDNSYGHSIVSGTNVQHVDDERLQVMTSRGVTDLSDIGFHRPEENRLITLHEMPNSFSSSAKMTVQNLSNKSSSVLEAVYV